MGVISMINNTIVFRNLSEIICRNSRYKHFFTKIVQKLTSTQFCLFFFTKFGQFGFMDFDQNSQEFRLYYPILPIFKQS